MAIDQFEQGMSQEDRKMAGLPYAVGLEQVTSRGETDFTLSESFKKQSIDWSRVLGHLSIHMDGDVAGSQFNGELCPSPEDTVALILAALPDEISFDQYNCAAITVDMAQNGEPLTVGWSGVKSVSEVEGLYPDAVIKQEIRMPGGMEETVDGLEGAWYPERRFDKQTQNSEVMSDAEGNPVNPRYKFEPKANMVHVNGEIFQQISSTSRITVIIVKDRGGQGQPMVVTAYPGDHAPAFPAILNQKGGRVKDTHQPDSPESIYWQDHVFIKPE